MQQLHEISNRLITNTTSSFYRSLYHRIDWNDRLIEIQGSRGVGKTTLMLQKANALSQEGKKVLYISLDIPYFYKNQLFETAENFYKYGGHYLFIDEVHKYPQKLKSIDWAQEIKSIYDTIPDLYIIYSGSSILQLYRSQGDLSRRKSSYLLKGLSFREYLQFYKKHTFDSLNLEVILNNHESISRDIVRQLRILPEFDNYLKEGYYPFFQENPEKYQERLVEVINVIIETDIPYITDIATESLHKFKQLLAAIASTVPYSLNLSNIASQLYIADQRTLIRYFNLLEKAALIHTIGAKAVGNKILSKPQKIYLNNSNLIYAIEPNNIQIGTVRETFFLNQLSAIHRVNYIKKADFIIDNEWTFEIGGKNKTQKQIQGLDKAFLAIDQIEMGFANRIPLWLFGFLY